MKPNDMSMNSFNRADSIGVLADLFMPFHKSVGEPITYNFTDFKT